MKIDVVPYDPGWAGKFNLLSHKLKEVIDAEGVHIEHIGSTSVFGLAAKPIIDILIGMPTIQSLNLLTKEFAVIAGIHYVPYWEDQMPFRRFFIWIDDSFHDGSIPRVIRDKKWNDIPHHTRLAHVHATMLDHPFYFEHLKFREILRNDDELRNEYEALKLKLANEEWQSGADYAGAKSSFIQNTLSAL